MYIADSGGGGGQRFGPDGRLYAVASKAKMIVAYESPEKRAEVATGFRGNDLVVAHNGGIYVTDPFETPNNSKVYYIGPKGEKKVVDTGLRFANGITLSPDQTLLYVATRLGIQVCDQAGRVNCIIPTPNGRVSNLTFGGENFDVLYATCGDKVYRRQVKARGANAFEPPLKPKPPQL